MSVTRSVVLGCGSYLPSRVVTNAELSGMVDTSDEWITQRTGIRERRIAADGEMTSDMGIKAARAALAAAGVEAQSIDLIVLATSTPDNTFPATAVVIQAGLGISQGAAFDLQAVCSGFVFSLATVDSLLRTGAFKRALVIGSETFSRLLDWTDRTTCVLFGDGAGAVVIRAGEGRGDASDRGVLHTDLYSDGRLHDLLYVDGGPSSTQTTGYLRMQGPEVFKHAVVNTTAAIHAAAAGGGVAISDIDWIVPHQANQRILDATARRLGIPAARVISTIAEHGNTSAASVPLALAAGLDDGRIKRGDLLLLEAMGGGFTWGAALVRW